jgi:predicted AlkP superfamily pyrophosphatase or phosphodiesterase
VKRTVVLNVVGLSRRHLGVHTPRLSRLLAEWNHAVIEPAFPAVTCTAQSDYLTGRRATDHGVTANGWYDRTLAEVHFWKQSNHVVTAPKIWDDLKAADPAFTCAQMFWWYNMYSGADWSVTPRPMYPADGRKFFDIYSWPYDLRAALKKDLGDFPFPTFWGPAAGVKTPQGEPDAATRWIAESAKWIEREKSPTLNLVYLPHLDYNLQRLGPSHPAVAEDLRRIDAIVGDLLDFFTGRGVTPIVLSEYGITPVSRPIHLNRLFRERGWVTIKEELGRELPDIGNSKAFAVADHQIAHVIVNDRTILEEVRRLLESTPGVAEVLGAEEKRARGIDHPRAGDLIAVSDEDAWFTYYHWMEDARAPDFARCVDIHRKPGYDPVELFLDPEIPAVKLKILWSLLKKKLGFRMLMDVIPLDARLVKGSHGARPRSQDDWPLLLSPDALPRGPISSTEVHGILKSAVTG